MKYLGLFVFLIGLFACSGNETEVKETEKPEELFVKSEGMYTEYYPGKKQIKLKGGIDDQERRHGVWRFYQENGIETSMTTYLHGKREGFSIVKYPSGAIYYRGEYRNDKTVGVWTFYDEKSGKITKEVDYGYPEE